MNGYQWTDASTPQGRERLKELLDGGVMVICKTGRMFQHTHSGGNSEYFHVGHQGIEQPVPEAKISEIKFLDPSPRLEPRPLEWARSFDKKNLQATDTWVASDGVYQYSAFPDGHWTVFGTGFSASGDSESAETAKAAIHEWRVNHLKSMTAGNEQAEG